VTDVRVNGRTEAMLLIGALGAAVLTFHQWGVIAILVATSAAVAVGVRHGLPLPFSVAGSATAGAAFIHFAVAPEHFREWWGFGVFFVLCGEAQLGWALLLRRRPWPLVAAVGLTGSLLLVALWLVSRTVGLPLGPDPGAPEAAGTADLVAVALELMTAFACSSALLSRVRGRIAWALGVRAAGLLLTGSLTALALLSINAG
jgi:hypothetical protein